MIHLQVNQSYFLTDGYNESLFLLSLSYFIITLMVYTLMIIILYKNFN